MIYRYRNTYFCFYIGSHLAQSDATPPLYAVILENTFTSIPEMGKRLFQVFILDYVPIWCYKNVVWVKNSSKWFSIFHLVFINYENSSHKCTSTLSFRWTRWISSSTNDAKITWGLLRINCQDLFQKIFIKECQSSKKQLVLFSDGQHNTTWFSNNYASHIRHFLTEVSHYISWINSQIILLFIVFNIIWNNINSL